MAGIADSKVGKLVRHAIGAALSPIHAGEEKIASKNPATAAPQSLHVSSEAFSPGAAIPLRYTPGGENVSPPLRWSGVPANARELVMIVEDPDAPFPSPFVHWILAGLAPTTTELPTGVPTTMVLPSLANAVQSQNDMKKPGYYGPEPPLGHGVHHYHFQLFALDTESKAGPDVTVAELVQRMRGHVLAEGELIGTYERKGT